MPCPRDLPCSASEKPQPAAEEKSRSSGSGSGRTSISDGSVSYFLDIVTSPKASLPNTASRDQTYLPRRTGLNWYCVEMACPNAGAIGRLGERSCHTIRSGRKSDTMMSGRRIFRRLHAVSSIVTRSLARTTGGTVRSNLSPRTESHACNRDAPIVAIIAVLI